jgi:hypothetical protein
LDSARVAAAALPDGELKTELEAAMGAYEDAGKAWDAVLRGGVLTKDREPGRTLSAKYGLNLGSGPDAAWAEYQEGMARLKGQAAPQRMEVANTINSAAKKHLDRASKLLGE